MELGGYMPESRLRLFLGKPYIYNGIEIYSPTIDEVSEISELRYNIYISLATFNREVILQDLLQIPEDILEQIREEDTYTVLTSIPVVVSETEKALSFFTRKNVKFNTLTFTYDIDADVFISKENYREVLSIIEKLNGISESEDKSKIKFKNEAARKMYEELMRRKKKNKNESDSLTLKDLLSILCHVEGNGINVFNVGKLTIYQVYEHFERFQIKEQHMRMLKVWANGYLGEKERLPEWIIKSKL